jgi:predicted Zn-dependent protease
LALGSEAHWAEGNTDAAQEWLSQAQALDPKDRFVLLQTARVAIHEGQTKSAIPALDTLLSSDPHDTESRHQLALCFRKLGMTERAEAESKRLEESQKVKRELSDLSDQAALEPTNADVRDRIALLFDKLGRPETAAIYRRAAEACRNMAKK